MLQPSRLHRLQMSVTRDQLSAFADHLATRREAILDAWRALSDADPEQQTARVLTRRQFVNRIPKVLDACERNLRTARQVAGAYAWRARGDQTMAEVKHGLHRWQQGYRLGELLHEWGHLQNCLFVELDRFRASRPDLDPETLVQADRHISSLVHDAVTESASQYERMQRAEAEGRLRDLAQALDTVTESERQRAVLIHQAVHDLGNGMLGVSVAADMLGRSDVADAARARLAKMMSHGIVGVKEMLAELMELARLEAGQEQPDIARFDAALLARELCTLHQAFAAARHLFLDTEGPELLVVDGDEIRVRRLLQNLLINALKYTIEGGVTVSWGQEAENWWLKVRDTGPGIKGGPGAPMVDGLQEATVSARESEDMAADRDGQSSDVLNASPHPIPAAGAPRQQTGEGIGLSIVKRLCELLDASLEMASSADTGTTFRVVFPNRPERG